MNPNFKITEGPGRDPGVGGEEKVMVFSTSEYPQLEGLEVGAAIPKITHTGNRVKEVAEGSVTVEVGSCEFEIDNQADKSLKEMVGSKMNGDVKSSGTSDLEY
jgi:hypothetical protein